ncbi:MAG: hypothetical protein K8S13_17330 [Desulfobacula sp.]|uniref:hypothetical protein n=1 Tax=Desulfobacula sp. TaxID=2593537 RepID=UPI0025C09374|nr:hypothetical protein [Desulfobacula sp.]MCD4721602.1 hypothetical protein [Desulfobacula sp.]
MTPENYKPNPEEMQKAMRTMQIRIRNIALRHIDSIDLRSLRILQDLDLFKDETPSIGDDLDLAVLRDPHHPKRYNLSSGPLVLYETEGEKPKRMLIELPVLIFSEIKNVRQAALECIERMAVKDPLALTPKTTSILKDCRDDLVSEAPEKWRQAAIAVSDALYDDIFIALNGTRQSLESKPVNEETLNFYTKKIIHPPVTSLDSISLPIGHPEQDHKALNLLLSDKIGQASNLAELCDSYLKYLGFLPLGPPYCLATAISKWLDSNPDIDAWKEVWGWAHANPSPLSNYHACSVFALFPELIPEGKLPYFWNEVVAIVKGAENSGTDHSEYEIWELRRDLARHYTFHLEAHLPENDGGSIGYFAWWFAEQVANLFPSDARAAKFYWENWVKPALDISGPIWIAASAPIKYSFLRYITFQQQSPWTTSLLILMGEQLENLAPNEQDEEIQAEFNDAIVRSAIFSIPFPIESQSDPTFVLECSLADTLSKWAKYQTEKHQKDLLELISTSRKLGSNDILCNALRKLGESTFPDQITVCLALKAKVAIDPTVAEDVWEIVSDAKWRKEVLGRAEKRILDLLIESLSWLLVDNKDKWFSYLPHYIAELCEKEEDEERRQALFLYVIHTSLASDTVSAVRRLIRGNQRAKFVDYVKDYRMRIEHLFSNYPLWVAAKLRGLLSSMHVH